MEKAFIYKITNLKNNKSYIGSTVKTKVEYRWNQHKSDAKKGKGFRLHKSMRKYGLDSFKFEVIFIVTNLSYIDEIEDYFIKIYNCIGSKGYNTMGVSFGNRQHIKASMRKEWSDPTKRRKRILAMIEGSRSRFKPVTSVCINSGKIYKYESVHSANRDGFSFSSIYNCLNNKAKTGQKRCWFYDKGEPDTFFIKNTLHKIKKFHKERIVPFYGQNKDSIIKFNFSKELKHTIFEWKGVHRSIKEGRMYKGFRWFWK
ncbi:MAG: hypothetical protein COB41_00355 [Proteobacteria bacterium]|nr:MAG: hypothetical protein COB41_00355 [Pseudomonadota bacterium]